MPTTFYFRTATSWYSDQDNIQTRSATLERGNGVNTITVNTVSGGTWISLGFWIVQPLVPFTLSGTISMNLWGRESNAQANASIGLRIHYLEMGLYSQRAQLNSTTEFGTADAVRTATGTPTSTTFTPGRFLVFEPGIIAIGTMGSGRTATFNYGGASSGANGDSFVTINENVRFTRTTRFTG